MPLKPVDQNIKVILGPCIDDTDFKIREELLAYNQAGMEIDVILEKHDGTIVTTAVVPTTAGDYDWAHTDQGYYEFELPASGGVSFNNTEEGSLRVVGYCTGVLPFSSVTYDIIPEKVWNSLIEGSDNLEVDLTHIMGTILTEGGAGRLAAAFIKLLDVVTPVLVASDVMRGTNGANTTIPDAAGTAPTKTEIVDEWEIQAVADPTGFKVNVMEVNGTAQTANDNGADINSILGDTNELQTDWTNAGRLDAILDSILAILDDARGEPGQGAPPVNPDAMTKLDYLYKSWRNKKTNDGTTRKIYNDAGAVVDQKSGLSEAAGTVTVDEMVSGP